MANRPGFPGKTNKVFPDPVPQEVPHAQGSATPHSAFAPVVGGSVNLGGNPTRRETHANADWSDGPTPMGASKKEQGEATWNAPVNGYPNPGRNV